MGMQTNVIVSTQQISDYQIASVFFVSNDVYIGIGTPARFLNKQVPYRLFLWGRRTSLRLRYAPLMHMLKMSIMEVKVDGRIDGDQE
jgi:hypothetical protein